MMNVPTNSADFNPTMSSREIAALVESRHDKVKQSIERLVQRGTIGQPPMGDDLYTDAQGKERTTSVYRVGKRDSYVIVAQLSPEFTARLVDRWQELEAQKATGGFEIPQSLSQALMLAAHQAEQIEAMKQDVAAHDRIAKADGSLNVTEAAKALQLRPSDLFKWLRENGWIYKRAGSANNLGYQSKTSAGLLEHKVTTVLRSDGSEKITEQVRVTPKGMSKLAKLVPSVASGVAS